MLALVVAGTYGAARLIGAVGGHPGDELIPEAGRPVSASGTLSAEPGQAPPSATPNPSPGTSDGGIPGASSRGATASSPSAVSGSAADLRAEAESAAAAPAPGPTGGDQGSARGSATPTGADDATGARGSGAAAAAPGSYRRLADSLTSALDRYQQRQRDFQSGMIGCTELARGYGTVDDAFVHLSIAFRSSEARDDARRQEYRHLAARADTVNRKFDASGCSRPR